MVPVTGPAMTVSMEDNRVEVVLSEARVRFPAGTAPEYVGALLLELKALAC